MRKIRISWYGLSQILKRLPDRSNLGLFPDEDIQEITLVKPRELLIRTVKKQVEEVGG